MCAESWVTGAISKARLCLQLWILSFMYVNCAKMCLLQQLWTPLIQLFYFIDGIEILLRDVWKRSKYMQSIISLCCFSMPRSGKINIFRMRKLNLQWDCWEFLKSFLSWSSREISRIEGSPWTFELNFCPLHIDMNCKISQYPKTLMSH